METIQNTLDRHLQSLKKKIENSEVISDDSKFKKFIEGLSFYIKKSNLDLNVNVEVQSKPCDQCGEHIKKVNQSKVITLNCKHTCCKDICLQNLVKLSNKYLTDWNETKCRVCGSYMQEDLITNAYGGVEVFEKIIKDYEEERAAKFVCNLCFMRYRVDESITLDCDHRFNRECITFHLTIAIDEGRVTDNDLSCPECMVPIGIPIIRDLVDKPCFMKFEKFRLRGFTPAEKGVFYKCTGNDCEYFEILDDKIWSFECPSCKTINCPKCRDAPHKGLTCEVNFQQKKKAEEDNRIDEEFKQAAKALGFKTCPHCKSMCEKISGCKFMRCYSPMCKGKNAFCLLCEVALVEAQHYSHYKAKGPFGEICNTMDGTPEDPIKR